MVDIRKVFDSNGIFARGFLVLLLLIRPIEFGFSLIILRIEVLVDPCRSFSWEHCMYRAFQFSEN